MSTITYSSSDGVITSDHNYSNAGLVELSDGRRYSRTGRVHQRQKANKRELLLHSQLASNQKKKKRKAHLYHREIELDLVLDRRFGEFIVLREVLKRKERSQMQERARPRRPSLRRRAVPPRGTSSSCASLHLCLAPTHRGMMRSGAPLTSTM